MVEWLNYHHLLYFWMVAKEGGITPAAELLHLSQPTLSTQVQKLEKAMGVQLFERKGRSITLTVPGQIVFRYADEIFSLGRELTDTIRGRLNQDNLRLTVGVPDVLPKLLVYKLLKPALSLTQKVKLICYEGKLNDLLSDLAMHKLDVVIADSPLAPNLNIRAFNHLLGECDVTVFGTSEMNDKYVANFPHSLNDAPMLLPTQNTTLRRALELWFDDQQIFPNVIHEFEDSALLKVFAQAGEGMVVVPSILGDEVCQQYRLQPIGRIPKVMERFYCVSIDRRLKHPAVMAISNAARDDIFAQQHA